MPIHWWWYPTIYFRCSICVSLSLIYIYIYVYNWIIFLLHLKVHFFRSFTNSYWANSFFIYIYYVYLQGLQLIGVVWWLSKCIPQRTSWHAMQCVLLSILHIQFYLKAQTQTHTHTHTHTHKIMDFFIIPSFPLLWCRNLQGLFKMK